MNLFSQKIYEPIFLCGKRGVGKDTLADFLEQKVQESGGSVVRVAFADPIRKLTMDMLSLKTKEQYDTFKRDSHLCYINHIPVRISGREFIRALGMGTRDFNENFYVDYVKDSYYKFLNDKTKTLFVVTDLRFENELDFALTNNGIIVKIDRESGQADSHISDKGISDSVCSAILKNGGTIESLYEKFCKCLKESLKIDSPISE